MTLRKLCAAAGATATALLLLSGCTMVRDAIGDPDPAGSETGAPASAKRGAAVKRPVIADPAATVPAEAALTLNRLGAEYLLAEVTVTSDAEGPWDSNVNGYTSFPSPQAGDYPTGDLSGLYWIGPEGRSAHLGYFTEGRACLCTRFENTQDWGATKDAPVKAAAVLPAPKTGVEKLTVMSPFSLPFVDVPIGDKKPDLGAYDIEHPDKADAEPEEWPLIGPSTTEDGSEEVSENAETTAVELAADVLFDLNKASLTAKAGTVLDRTAKRLDAGTATKVDIAGHTDDSGTDSINEPLSRRRAETVEKALAERVERDISFTTKGYGSTKPIADNATEEGAAKNRRVTVEIPRAKDTGAAGAASGEGASAPPKAGRARPMSAFAETVTSPDSPDDQAKLTGLGLERIGKGTVLLSYAMENLRDSSENLSPFWASDSETALSSLAGTTATDPASGRIYQTMVIDQRAAVGPASSWAYCACSLTSAGTSFVAFEDTRTLYALLPVPDSVSVLDLSLGEEVEFKNARIDR